MKMSYFVLNDRIIVIPFSQGDNNVCCEKTEEISSN